MSTKLYDHAAEARVLAVLSDVSVSSMGANGARTLLDKHQVSASDFHLSQHGEVFTAIQGLLARDLPADAASVSDSLKASATVKPGWVVALLTNAGHVETAFPTYAKTVREMSLRRSLYRHAEALMKGALDLTREPGDVLAGGRTALGALVEKQPAIRTAQAVAMGYIDELEEIDRGERVPVVATGIEMLDKVIGGMQRRKLTVLGAEPSAGKSAIAATVLDNMAKRGHRCALFSLEDHPSWLVARHVANASGVPVSVMRNRRLNEHQKGNVDAAFQRLWNGWGNVFIDDREFLTPKAIAASMVDLIVNHGVREFIIDNLAEVRFEKAHRDRQDLNILDGLQEIRSVLKQHDASCLLLTHVTRESSGKAPTLKDFPGSAAIERMARVAIIATPDERGATLYLLKQTEGLRNVRIHLEFNKPAAMVRPLDGSIDEAPEAA